MVIKHIFPLLILLCANAYGEDKPLPPTTKEYKSCYVANMKAKNQKWITRTQERISYTRQQEYYKRNSSTKKSYEQWFKVETDKLSKKRLLIQSLEKKYGTKDASSKECKKYWKFYFLGDDFESRL
ncbi:hypothetical protein M902_2337 [Bacteriovorax sp. BAL6_X]|uniref:hypothetical protein n=1 Tax=Bacteriovorax sp. BAL6_X TaxID=1201290 RepID=UPI000386E14A|nr:hypothetical protein [Bacteriovorax sp. BAL6_X]EPZ51981.1 hypothetical protein M902_2337 [Bacteriovorax sp. BAL6_X]